MPSFKSNNNNNNSSENNTIVRHVSSSILCRLVIAVNVLLVTIYVSNLEDANIGHGNGVGLVHTHDKDSRHRRDNNNGPLSSSHVNNNDGDDAHISSPPPVEQLLSARKERARTKPIRKPGDALIPHPTHNEDSSSTLSQLIDELSYMKSKPRKTNNSSTALDRPRSKPEHDVIRIAHLGERNSGTRWVHSELKKCFPKLVSLPRLLRWKHWFQTSDHKKYGEHRQTLTLIQFRNPYEWVEAMRHVPHNAPYHALLDWKGFVTKPWTMPERPKRDVKFVNTTGKCYDKFSFNEVMPCVEGHADDPEYLSTFDEKTGLNRFGYRIDDPHDFSAHKPIYELRRDGSGLPFKNILEMRAAKIRNFVDTANWDWVEDAIPIQYEMMLEEGTEKLIARVEEITGLKRQCKPAGPQKQRSRRILDPRFVKYLSDHIDWDAEKLIGYEKWDDPTEKDVEIYDEMKAREREEREEDEEQSGGSSVGGGGGGGGDRDGTKSSSRRAGHEEDEKEENHELRKKSDMKNDEEESFEKEKRKESKIQEGGEEDKHVKESNVKKVKRRTKERHTHVANKEKVKKI